MSDTTKSIMKSAGRFFSGTMLSRISGMVRDMTMAYAFGTQEAISGFLVAFRLSHLLRRIFGEGALQSAFIPQFETLRSEHPATAGLFFRDLAYKLSVLLMLIILLAMSLLGMVWMWGDLDAGNLEIVGLTILLMPSLLFICLFGLNASLLQCEKSYFIPGVAPVAFNVLWAAGVCTLWNLPQERAMQGLTGWVIAACMAQWAMTLPQTWKILHRLKDTQQEKAQQSFEIKKLFSLSPELKGLFKPLLLGILGVAAAQINNALDAIFARYADSEGPALLWYALRIQQLPVALFGVAISGALLPPLTRALKEHDTARFRQFLEFAMRRSVALLLPITAGIFIMGDTCVNLLYGRGDFGAQSTVGTTLCLWGYGIGLLPTCVVLILAPAFYAQKNPRVPATISVVAVGLNVGLNALLISGLGLGAASVAVATSASAWVNCLLLGYFLEDTRFILGRKLGLSLCRVALASTAAILAVIAVDVGVIGHSSVWQILNGEIPNLSQALSVQLWCFFIQGAAFTSAFFAIWSAGPWHRFHKHRLADVSNDTGRVKTIA
ncbi:MAG: murein biosynthesis integral membrane protein MurJ [Parachlamydiaceae bacterium]|nr:murein biosynthesis integral membrane protein MurJ [Parachlamydiaceae bacterium]